MIADRRGEGAQTLLSIDRSDVVSLWWWSSAATESASASDDLRYTNQLKTLSSNKHSPRSCLAMSACRWSAETEPKMTSISSSERPFVSGMSLNEARTRSQPNTDREAHADVQREGGHSADVDSREHEEDLVPQRGDQARRDLGEHEVYRVRRSASHYITKSAEADVLKSH